MNVLPTPGVLRTDDLPAQPAGKALADRQSQAGPRRSARRRGPDAVEGLKQARQLVLGVRPDAGVAHIEHKRRCRTRARRLQLIMRAVKRDRAPLGELDRVVQQVDEDLLEPQPIVAMTAGTRRVEFALEPQLLGLRLGPNRLDGIGQDLCSASNSRV